MWKATEQLIDCCPTDEMEDAVEALEEGLARAEIAVENAREEA
jgi:hypothetical protein